ncbi:MAG: hypothetical protein AAB701_01655 [Patescibacteria group bacterium]
MTSLITTLTIILETLLIFRAVFIIFGASGVSLVQLIMRVSDPLVQPFVGLVPAMRYGSYLIDWPTVLALIAYGILSFLLIEMVHYLTVRLHR